MLAGKAPGDQRGQEIVRGLGRTIDERKPGRGDAKRQPRLQRVDELRLSDEACAICRHRQFADILSMRHRRRSVFGQRSGPDQAVRRIPDAGRRSKQDNETIEILADILFGVGKIGPLWATRRRRQVEYDVGTHIREALPKFPFRPQVEAVPNKTIAKMLKPLVVGTRADHHMHLMAGLEAGFGQMGADEASASSDENPRHPLLLRAFYGLPPGAVARRTR